jgi:peptide-methionine (S)-S-oxide reductase
MITLNNLLWCTEAVFQSLRGVTKVQQGYIASSENHTSFSEAVIVHFNPNEVRVKILIEIHLRTHKSTSSHSMRSRYRSAIYTFSNQQKNNAIKWVSHFQKDFEHQLITLVLPFIQFKESRESIQNYYYNNPEKPFCQRFIDPKLQILLTRFSDQVQKEKVTHLQTTYEKY